MCNLHDLGHASRVQTLQPGTCLQSVKHGRAGFDALNYQRLYSREGGRIGSRELAVQSHQLSLESPGHPQVAGVIRGQTSLGSKVEDGVMIDRDLFHPEPMPQVKGILQRLALICMPPALEEAYICQLEADE
jgi:hypothetical protein